MDKPRRGGLEGRPSVGLGVTGCAGLLALLAAGCAAHPGYSTIPMGTLASPGTRIDAVDHSFSLLAGQTFRPPFSSWTPVDYPDLATSDYRASLDGGAKRVLVTVPGRAQPLYGVLALEPRPDCATGPGTRSYQIQVPQSYIDAASGGRISDVAETVDCSCCPGGQQYTWMLWLSDRPMP